MPNCFKYRFIFCFILVATFVQAQSVYERYILNDYKFADIKTAVNKIEWNNCPTIKI